MHQKYTEVHLFFHMYNKMIPSRIRDACTVMNGTMLSLSAIVVMKLRGFNENVSCDLPNDLYRLKWDGDGLTIET